MATANYCTPFGSEVTPILVSDSTFRSCDCPRCGDLLEFFLPVPEKPERMLATCSACDAWYYVSVSVIGHQAALIRLPEAEPVIGRSLSN